MGYKSEVWVIGAELALGRVVEVKFSRGSRVAFVSIAIIGNPTRAGYKTSSLLSPLKKNPSPERFEHSRAKPNR
jgi:hypothetical protein